MPGCNRNLAEHQPVARGPRLLANAALAAQTILRGLSDDPLEFIVQLRRRFPQQVGGLLQVLAGRYGRCSSREAFQAWLRDEPELARTILSAHPDEWKGLRRMLAAHLELEDSTWDSADLLRVAPQATEKLTSSVYTSDISVFHLLTNSLPFTTSGYSLRSHNVLLAQRNAGIRVEAATRLGYPVIIGSLNAPPSSVVDGIRYHRLLPNFLGQTLQARIRQAANLLTPIVEEFGADILSTTTDYVNALVAERVAASLGIPWTYEIRGVPEDTWVAQRHNKDLQKRAEHSAHYAAQRMRETQAAMRSHHIFALGKALRSEFISRGVRPDKISMVQNAASARRSTYKTSSRARAALGLPREGLWIGSVSSLVAYEGFDTLIKAVSICRRRGVDIRVLLVGDGIARPSLELLAHESGLDPQSEVLFTGRVSPMVARQYYQTLDLFAVPRRNNRVCRLVQPLKPLEACAAGIPLITSDLPALEDFTGDGSSGIMLPAEDENAWAETLCSLAEDSERLSALRHGARQTARTCTWPAEAEKYRRTYINLLHEGRTA